MLASAAAVLAAALPAVGAVPAAPPAQAETRATEVPLAIDRLTPSAPDPDSTIRVSGSVTNVTDFEQPQVDVRLRYSAIPLTSRDALQEYLEGSLEPGGLSVSESVSGTLGVNESSDWSLEVPAAELPFTEFGVYPIAIEAVNGAGVRIAYERTLLPFDGANAPDPTSVAWIWPLIDTPQRVDDTTFLDQQLDTSLAPDGRLGQLLAVGDASTIPLTWAIDPALLDDAEAMAAESYQLAAEPPAPDAPSPSAEPAPEPSAVPGSENARAWLEDLRGAVEPESLITTPYADPDVVGLIDGGLEEDINSAVTEGTVAANRVLESVVQNGISWAPDGMLDPDARDVLAARGTDTFVVSDLALPVRSDVGHTPDAAATISSVQGELNAVVTDSGITEAISADTRTATAATQARQLFLAETALISLERPEDSRTVVAAPDRHWNPDPEFAAGLLDATRSASWLQPVSLADAVDGTDSTGLRGELRIPDGAAPALGRQALDEVAAVRTDITNLTGALSAEEGAAERAFERAVLRMESASWATYRDRAAQLRDAVSTAVAADAAQIRVVPGEPITLAGQSGTAPVVVANDLDHAVTVRLTAVSENPARLEVGEFEDVLEIGSEGRATVQIPLRAGINGPSEITLQLSGTDGRPISEGAEAVVMPVAVTGLGSTAMWITVAAVAILVGAVGMRVLRRIRRAGRHEEPPAPAPRADDGSWRPDASTPERPARPAVTSRPVRRPIAVRGTTGAFPRKSAEDPRTGR
ncbi:hypothetical protein CLV72_103160 [Allonocardiopsis opalescens]|uniref:Glycoprotein n=2 Tax=Allonocardiopsis opalescens TaxID=1144618 RepID=A0A2T0Q6V5_9ACTN|nr:hypothetical protein CLV72_103160 [Allonocardiopsis opalescens]